MWEGVIESDRMAFGQQSKGIIPRSVEAIFNHIAAHPETRFHIRCSYQEVYNDKVYDLFNYEHSRAKPQGLEVRARDEGAACPSVFVQDLKEQEARSAEEIYALLEPITG